MDCLFRRHHSFRSLHSPMAATKCSVVETAVDAIDVLFAVLLLVLLRGEEIEVDVANTERKTVRSVSCVFPVGG